MSRYDTFSVHCVTADGIALIIKDTDNRKSTCYALHYIGKKYIPTNRQDLRPVDSIYNQGSKTSRRQNFSLFSHMFDGRLNVFQFLLQSQTDQQTDRPTDRHRRTDRQTQTDRQTDKLTRNKTDFLFCLIQLKCQIAFCFCAVVQKHKI